MRIIHVKNRSATTADLMYFTQLLPRSTRRTNAADQQGLVPRARAAERIVNIQRRSDIDRTQAGAAGFRDQCRLKKTRRCRPLDKQSGLRRTEQSRDRSLMSL